MFGNLSSVALTAAGAYLTYSGIQGVRDTSKNKSTEWELAKTILGVTIIAGQIDFAMGGEGLSSRLIDLAKTIQDRITGINAPKSLSCEDALSQVSPFLKEEESNFFSDIAALFKKISATKGVTCDNYLPFHPEDPRFIKNLRPEDLKHSIMWGIDSCQGPFAAIKYTCDKIHKGVISFFPLKGFGDRIDWAGNYRVPNCISYGEVHWLRDLLNNGTAQVHLYSNEAPHSVYLV